MTDTGMKTDGLKIEEISGWYDVVRYTKTPDHDAGRDVLGRFRYLENAETFVRALREGGAS